MFAVVFSILGLTPSLSWIPEVPLLAAAVIIPVAILLVTGHRAYARTLDIVAAMLAGSLAGALGGLAGGVSYMVAGKSAVNVVAGLLAGVVGGGFLVGMAPRSRVADLANRLQRMTTILEETLFGIPLPALGETPDNPPPDTRPIRSQPAGLHSAQAPLPRM